ncbi:hypothetical protein Q7C36_010029 [Tachysurus vachellii]|uniref:Ig-like domain-containing protein n=1 Tax=Tachysurus vachellii TaxID=175792 RepID=A0AA88N0E0_TACVA|nr:hypothetical protein Q7C36_010029 [Tachysurus vachellii]
MPRFVIMLMILVIWFSQTEGQEIYPAKVYSDKYKGKLKFTCSTFGLKNTPQNNQFYIYLCRNGIAIDMKSGCRDVTFYIDDNRKDNTGNYSCVFSVHKHNFDQVIQNGINFIFITTNDSFVPAVIALSQTNVITGSDVEFQCTSLNLPDRIQKGNVYAVLYKNSTVIQMTIWDMTKNKARFTLKEVSIQDAGTYICCLMSEPFHFPKNVHGVNEVILHVTDVMIYLAALLLVGVVFIQMYRYRLIIYQHYHPVFERNLVRLVFSVGVIMFACFVVVFDIKTRSHASRTFTSSVKTKDEIDA